MLNVSVVVTKPLKHFHVPHVPQSSHADLTSSHFIKNMLEIMAIREKAKVSATCSRCKDPAINHCGNCEMFMCKKCSEWHDKHKQMNFLIVMHSSRILLLLINTNK
jgi:hypothetical protein